MLSWQLAEIITFIYIYIFFQLTFIFLSNEKVFFMVLILASGFELGTYN